MPHSNLGKALIYSAAILIADVFIVGSASFILGRNLSSYYTLILMLEAAVLLFTGGFRSPTIIPVEALKPDIRRDWSLLLTGLLLLAASFLLAYPLG